MMKVIALEIPDAQGNPIQINNLGIPQGGPNSVAAIVRLSLDLLVLGALFICLFYLVWGGINWLMSEGEKQRINQARQKIVYAILGLAVVFVSFLIINAFYWFILGDKVNPFIYGY